MPARLPRLLGALLFLLASLSHAQDNLLYGVPKIIYFTSPLSVSPSGFVPASECVKAAPSACRPQDVPDAIIYQAITDSLLNKANRADLPNAGPVRYNGLTLASNYTTFAQFGLKISLPGSVLSTVPEHWVGGPVSTCASWKSPGGFAFAQSGLDLTVAGTLRSCTNGSFPVMCLCSSVTPSVTSATIADDGFMVIAFDSPTNRGGGSALPFNCSDVLTISPTPVDFAKFLCRFTQDNSMQVISPATTNFHPSSGNATYVQFQVPAPNRIGDPSGLDPLGVWSSPIYISPASPVVVNAPWLSAPDRHPLCNPNLTLGLWADFAAGRKFSGAVLNLKRGNFSSNFSAAFDLDALTLKIPSAVLKNNTIYTFSVTLTNWIGSSAESNDVTVFTTTGPAVALTFVGGNQPVSQRQDQELRLQAQTYLDTACLSRVNLSLLTFAYSWQAFVLPNITWAGTQAGVPVSVPPGLLPPSNGLLLSPQQLTLAKSVGRFLSLRVSVKAVSALGDVVLGSAAQAIELLDLDVNMVLRGPAYVFTVAAEDRTTKVVFDSSASCDPNKFGLGCVGTPNNVSVYYYSGTSPSIEYLAPGQLPGQFTWQLYEHVGVDNITLAQMGIYEFLVSDTFSQAGQFRMTVTGSPSSTNEANVNAVWYFTVLDPKIGCTLPELQMPVFPLSSITLQPPSVTLPDASPFFIRASVNDFGIPGVQYSWNESSDAINYVPIPPTWADRADRPVLGINPGVLQPGATYTFRLQALSPGCSTPAQGDVVFTVNAPPVGGALQVTPSSGVAFQDTFLITAGQFVDPDLPLQYSFVYRRQGATNPIALNAVSTSQTLSTRLAPSDGTGGLLATCYDALGAKAYVGAQVVVSPLYSPGDPCAALPKPASVIQAVKVAGGQVDDIMRALQALADAATPTLLTGQNATDKDCLQLWRTSISLAVILTVQSSLAQGGLSLRQLAMQINALNSALSGAAAGLDGPTLSLAGDLVRQLIRLAVVAADSDSLGAFQGGSQGLISVDTGGSLLDAISGLVTGITHALTLPGQRRQLDANDLRSGESNLKQAVKDVATAVLRGFEAGGPSQTVMGALITCVLSREDRDSVGSSGGVNDVQVPTSGDPLAQLAVHLPPGVLSGDGTLKLNGTTVAPPTVDIAVCRFKFNLRELVDAAKPPPGYTGVSATTDKANVPGVLFTGYVIKEVCSIFFLGQDDSAVEVDPVNLTTPINITIPLQAGYIPPSANNSDVSCGAWDDSFDGWGVSGCTLIEKNFSGGYIKCSCTHASDFSAWNSFVADVSDTTVGVVATIAIVVLGVLLPALVALWLASLLWAARRDAKDADNVQLGALVLLTKNKLRQRAQVRRFFRLLRANAKNPAPLVVDPAKLADLQQARAQERAELRRKTMPWWERHLPTMLSGFITALMYEHSMWGTFTRFDPWYTRGQRFTVLAAMIVGNLFAASFFFDLKQANDVTFGFLVGEVLLAAVVVAVPVKLAVRWLFRTTEQALGSSNDRVVAIYRVSARNADLLPSYALAAERADLEVVLCFKAFYLARSDTARLARAGGDVSKLPAELRRQSLEQRLGAIHSDVDLAKATLRAGNNLEDARGALRQACAKAREEWAKVPRADKPNARVETLRKQQSTVMKMASLIYDETDTRARPRPQSCGPQFIYVAWGLLIGYLVAGLAYSAFWVVQRTSYRGALGVAATDAQVAVDANAIIVAWLVSAFVGVLVGLFFIEPAIQFVRFGFMAWLLRTCGKGTAQSHARVEPEDAEQGNALLLVPDSPHHEETDKARKNGLEGKAKDSSGKDVAAYGAFDVIADVVNAIA